MALDEALELYFEESKTPKVTKIEKPTDASEETSKQGLLLHILITLLKLWHPYTPFVTEELWRNLKQSGLLIVAPWPVADKSLIDANAEKEFGLIQKVVTAIRNLRQSKKIPPANKIKATIYAGASLQLLQKNAQTLSHLGRFSDLTLEEKGSKVANAISDVIDDIHIYITLDDQAVNLEDEAKRMDKEIEETSKYIVSLETRLKNKEFIDKAPKKVVKEQEEKLKLAEEKLKGLKEERAALAK